MIESGRHGRPSIAFVNSERAHCSIYSSGKMFYELVKKSEAFHVDYYEINVNGLLPEGYLIYIINYHHVTTKSVDVKNLRRPGLLVGTIVLETSYNNPIPYLSSEDFDFFLILEPDGRIMNEKFVYLPRPLLSTSFVEKPRVQLSDSIVAGSFGYPTPGKGYEQIAAALAAEFKRSTLRLHIPRADFASDKFNERFYQPNYVNWVYRNVKDAGLGRVNVEISRDFLEIDDLIEWCRENDINCFFYTRDQPGLAATTDQAILSGSALAINCNPTFRHLHRFLPPYPYWNISESIENSPKRLSKIISEWSESRFLSHFDNALLQRHNVLTDRSILPLGGTVTKKRAVSLLKFNDLKILAVNHAGDGKCGVYQYGRRVFSEMNRLSRFKINCIDCESADDFFRDFLNDRYDVVVFNHYPMTMPWVNHDLLQKMAVPSIGIGHEIKPAASNSNEYRLFTKYLLPDPTLQDRSGNWFRVPRIIPFFTEPPLRALPFPNPPVVGCFGFAFPDKGFHRVVDAVQSEWDQATIRFRMPVNRKVDPCSELFNQTIALVRASLKKPGIKIQIDTRFIEEKELIEFLSQNDLNVFLYGEDKDRGISSVLDLALAVHRPIAVSASKMFRHVTSVAPFVEYPKASLKSNILRGVAYQASLRLNWTGAAFVKRFEEAVDSALQTRDV